MNPHFPEHKCFELIRSLHRGVALLIDPEKVQSAENLHSTLQLAEVSGIDLLFVGGSTVSKEQMTYVVDEIKKRCTLPVILFPGSSQQITHQADALLYLSLISGRNPDYLIGHHVSSAAELFNSRLEVIPTGYVLIDGGKMTSVAYVSQTNPIPRDQISIVKNTCMAGLLLGQQLIYLDSGSGALEPVPTAMINEIASLGSPVIVGGGIRSIETMNAAHAAGANLVVIGNHIEEHVDFLLDIASYKTSGF